MIKNIYLDIDGVLVLSTEIKPKNTKWGWIYPFNKKAVRLLNEILLLTNASIIVSSDWKYNYDIAELREIFEWNKVVVIPEDITPHISKKTVQTLEIDRAKEIIQHVETYKPDRWCVIDDLNLTSYINEEHFVWCKRGMEGIKQLSIKEKIIKILNYD